METNGKWYPHIALPAWATYVVTKTQAVVPTLPSCPLHVANARASSLKPARFSRMTATAKRSLHIWDGNAGKATYVMGSRRSGFERPCIFSLKVPNRPQRNTVLINWNNPGAYSEFQTHSTIIPELQTFTHVLDFHVVEPMNHISFRWKSSFLN